MGTEYSENQEQTADAFGFKWKLRDTYDSPAVQGELQRWLMEKYFDSHQHLLEKMFDGGGKRILDAGCGSGLSSLLLFKKFLKANEYVGVDISESVEVGRQRFAEEGVDGEFHQIDLMNLPEELGTFDVIFSEGVLHHTDSVELAIVSLSKKLRPHGVFMFYVYAKKAPVREFTDDFIRREIATLSNQQAWDALKPLSKLGMELGRLAANVTVEDEVPILGIEKGQYDIQRLFYYAFCKMFYHPDFTLDEMTHINFDWFRPANCHRHSPNEIREFCARAGLKIQRIHHEPSGISVIGSLA